jgi:hypothetical protein
MKYCIYVWAGALLVTGGFFVSTQLVTADEHCDLDGDLGCDAESDAVPLNTVFPTYDESVGTFPGNQAEAVQSNTTGSKVQSNTTGSKVQSNTTGSKVQSNTTDPSGKSNSLFDPLGGKTIEGIFQAILDILMVFAIPIVVFFIVFAGFKYVTAQGNETKLAEATQALTYAVIGGLIVLGANVLLAIITNTIDVFK